MFWLLDWQVGYKAFKLATSGLRLAERVCTGEAEVKDTACITTIIQHNQDDKLRVFIPRTAGGVQGDQARHERTHQQ